MEFACNKAINETVSPTMLSDEFLALPNGAEFEVIQTVMYRYAGRMPGSQCSDDIDSYLFANHYLDTLMPSSQPAIALNTDTGLRLAQVIRTGGELFLDEEENNRASAVAKSIQAEVGKRMLTLFNHELTSISADDFLADPTQR